MLLQVLVESVNTGYTQLQTLQVLRINGTELLNLKHLRQLIEQSTDDFIKIDFEDNRLAYIHRESGHKAAASIMERYRIPALQSPDLAEA